MIRPTMIRLLVLLLVPAFLHAQQPDDRFAAARDIIAASQGIVTPDGVQESFIVTLGGARQAVSVRGAHRANPLLLFVHGGPGSVEMPMAWTFQRPWEDYFTVVQWDQRGAGKSYPLNDPKVLAPTMTLDRYRDDAIELIQLLTRKYAQRKVVLVGHSRGLVRTTGGTAKEAGVVRTFLAPADDRGAGPHVPRAGRRRASAHRTRAASSLD